MVFFFLLNDYGGETKNYFKITKKRKDCFYESFFLMPEEKIMRLINILGLMCDWAVE